MRLTARRWAMEIRPQRGGRITSLRLDGDELLDQGIGVDQPTEEGFVAAGAFGWDEMVPNVEPTDTLPDHGEAWRVPWEVMSLDSGSAVMRASGRIVPWELTRTIELGDELTVSYGYRNVGSTPHLAYWCAHPLFKYQAEMKIGLAGPGLSTLTLPGEPEGESKKVFLPRGSFDRARLRWTSGPGIELSWDASATPYVGVWMCNGDLGGYRQLAIEPATGGNDGPDPSAPPPSLEPGETLQWWLRIRAL